MQPIHSYQRLCLSLACVLTLALPAHSATVNLATSPLATSSTTTVKPNLMFILDDSLSMTNDYMPDNAGSLGSTWGTKTAQCNGVAYNPNVTYVPPAKADGSSYPDVSFTAACSNGFSGSCSTNLTGRTYYTYSGSETPLNYTYTSSGVDTSTTFYKECNDTGGAYAGKFTQVTVNSTSGPSGTDERTNYANWYSYYRTRLLMMKTAAGLAFKNIGSNFRVGFSTISDTGGTDGNTFLHIQDFTSDGTTTCSSVASTNQKQCWYKKLYAIAGANSTPLRGALSKAGQMFAGKLTSGSDPMQYSCQQNFAILSTDGYWNTGDETTSYGPLKLDNSTHVGEQDGSGTPRPLFDGQAGTTTEVTTTTTPQTGTVAVTKYYVYTQKDSCSSSKRHQYTTTYIGGTAVASRTQTSTRTVVTTNGVVTSDTTSSSTSATSYTPTLSAVSDYTSNSTALTGASCSSGWSTGTSYSTTGPSTWTDGTSTTTTTSSTSTSGGSTDSLADVAMYYYVTDLRDNSLGNCTSPITAADVCKNNVSGTTSDNNTQQHMTTFTLGLGVNGTLTYSSSYETDTSGDFFSIKNGTLDWPVPSSNSVKTVDDLWHAAVDGHGTYFSAKDPTSLSTSLTKTLANVSAKVGYGTAAATSSLDPVEGDNAIYLASYTSAQWTGNLQALTIDPSTGAVSSASTWCVENIAADTVNGIAACTGTYNSLVGPNSDSRNIKFNFSGTLTNFTYANLPSGYQAWFSSSLLSQYSSTYTSGDKTAATGASLVNFLRGQTQYENQAGNTTLLYRDRTSTFGDVVDSQPVYVKQPYFNYTDPGYSSFKSTNQNRTPTIYVGANDGMLHAITASTGTESWAFVPTPVMPKMYWLADFNYSSNHHFYVNGKTTIADVCVASCSDPVAADWRTILIGSLNGGGRGYYALDVTNPAAPTMLWEFTSLSDSDVGFSFGNPIAVKKSDGTWVILVTSGYNNVLMGTGDPYDASGTGRGYLFVLNPLTGAKISKISTGVGDTTTPSGLARIAAWVDNQADNTALNVYGGDLLGNVWRFDINSGSVAKLATLTDTNGDPQPITTKPELSKVGTNRMVFVGTGKYLEASDLTNTQTQTVYAIKDTGATVTTPRSSLVEQVLTNTTSGGLQVRNITNNAVDLTVKSGWYVDLPDSGERSNVNMLLVQGTLLVPTNVPTNGVCEAGGYSWFNYFNYATGSLVSGATNAGQWMGNAMITGLNVVWINGKPQPYVTQTGGGGANGNGGLKQTTGIPFNPNGGAGAISGHRVTWRELITQ